jgi:hypothetical protein
MVSHSSALGLSLEISSRAISIILVICHDAETSSTEVHCDTDKTSSRRARLLHFTSIKSFPINGQRILHREDHSQELFQIRLPNIVEDNGFPIIGRVLMGAYRLRVPKFAGKIL